MIRYMGIKDMLLALPILMTIYIGIVNIFLGLYFLISPFQNKRACKSKTTAKVIDITPNSSGNGRAKYALLFCYIANGKEIVVKQKMGSSYKLGDTVTLFYNPKKPKQYYIEGTGNGKWVKLAIGIVLILSSLFVSLFLSLLKS